MNAAKIIEESRVVYMGVSKTLDDLLLKQEIFWTQRSRIAWLKHRDKNTKYLSLQSIPTMKAKSHPGNKICGWELGGRNGRYV